MNASSSLTPQHQSLRTQLQQLEAEMRSAGLWGALPPSEQAMASTMPFMYDTLQIEEWLQWVFVPRLHAAFAGQRVAEHEWTQRTVPQHQAALRQLALIDALLSGKPA